MNRKAAIDLLSHSVDAQAHARHLWIVGHDGVVVKCDNHAVFVPKRLLDVIERVVTFQRAGLGCHLGVSACELPARAVVVNHQIVNSQNAGIAHDLVSNVLDQLRIGRLTQKRAHRILNKFKAAPANIGANGKANPCVKIDVRHLRNNCTCQHGACGKDIVLGILRGRMQRLGLDTIAELLVEGRHPELYGHRKRQDCHQGKRELDRFGVDDALNRGLHQLNADQQHERRHDQTREILVAAMSVRMLGVRRLARQLKAQHAHDIRAGIGQVVHGIRHNRNRSRNHTNCTLRSTKRNIGDNTHHAR